MVVGFGNLLMGDDGVGVHVVRELSARGLPAGVEALDGGVSSLEVLGSLLDSGRLIIVDALRGGGRAGAIYRLAPGDLGAETAGLPLTLHDLSLAQAIRLLGRAAALPPTVIFGIEPADIAPGLELSPAVAEAAARAGEIILAEIREEPHARNGYRPGRS